MNTTQGELKESGSNKIEEETQETNNQVKRQNPKSNKMFKI